MKKSTFIALLMGTAGGMLFALGMCMALIPEWNAFVPGIVFGCAGLLIGVAAVPIWRKMTRKAPVHLSRKALRGLAVGISGTLLLGLGMCLCMVWNHMAGGILLGLFGILLLLCLIPVVKGLKP